MKRMASASLSAAMMMTAAAPVVTSLPVMAASSANTNNNTADTKDLAHADVIDMSKTISHLLKQLVHIRWGSIKQPVRQI